MPTAPLSGRRAQAARNDALVLRAAREVLSADPDAPISAIAAAAGVGMGTLYRRFASREALVHRLCLDSMGELEGHAQAALARAAADPWEAFAGFMAACAASGAGSLLRLAGTFAPTPELLATAEAMRAAADALLAHVQRAAAVREDIGVADLNLLLTQLRAAPDALRPRYLALLLQALRAPGAEPLPGPAPTWEDVRRRWTVTASPASRPPRR